MGGTGSNGDSFGREGKSVISAIFSSITMYLLCQSSDLPGLKTSLPHLPTKPWSEDEAPVLRLGRSEDGAGGRKMGQGQKMGQVLKSSFSKYFIKNCLVYHFFF